MACLVDDRGVADSKVPIFGVGSLCGKLKCICLFYDDDDKKLFTAHHILGPPVRAGIRVIDTDNH